MVKTVIILFLSYAPLVAAQAPTLPGRPELAPGTSPVPVDGGLVWLGIAALGLGARRLMNRHDES